MDHCAARQDLKCIVTVGKYSAREIVPYVHIYVYNISLNIMGLRPGKTNICSLEQ